MERLLVLLLCHVSLIHAASGEYQRRTSMGARDGDAYETTLQWPKCTECRDNHLAQPNPQEAITVADFDRSSPAPSTAETLSETSIPSGQPSEVVSEIPSESFLFSVSPTESLLPSVVNPNKESFGRSESMTPSYGPYSAHSSSFVSSVVPSMTTTMPSIIAIRSDSPTTAMTTESSLPSSSLGGSPSTASSSTSSSSPPPPTNNDDTKGPTLLPTCIECDDYPYIIIMPKGSGDQPSQQQQKQQPSTTTTGMPSNSNVVVPSESFVPSAISMVPSSFGVPDQQENRGRGSSLSHSSVDSSVPTVKSSIPSAAPNNDPSVSPSSSVPSNDIDDRIIGDEIAPPPTQLLPPSTPFPMDIAILPSSNSPSISSKSKILWMSVVALSTCGIVALQ